jgi:hypothetical protein
LGSEYTGIIPSDHGVMLSARPPSDEHRWFSDAKHSRVGVAKHRFCLFSRLLKNAPDVIASDPFAMLRAGSGSEAISIF